MTTHRNIRKFGRNEGNWRPGRTKITDDHSGFELYSDQIVLDYYGTTTTPSNFDYDRTWKAINTTIVLDTSTNLWPQQRCEEADYFLPSGYGFLNAANVTWDLCQLHWDADPNTWNYSPFNSMLPNIPKTDYLDQQFIDPWKEETGVTISTVEQETIFI